MLPASVHAYLARVKAAGLAGIFTRSYLSRRIYNVPVFRSQIKGFDSSQIGRPVYEARRVRWILPPSVICLPRVDMGRGELVVGGETVRACYGDSARIEVDVAIILRYARRGWK